MAAQQLGDLLLVHEGQLHAAAEEPGLLLGGQLGVRARRRDLRLGRQLLDADALVGALLLASGRVRAHATTALTMDQAWRANGG